MLWYPEKRRPRDVVVLGLADPQNSVTPSGSGYLNGTLLTGFNSVKRGLRFNAVAPIPWRSDGS